MSVPASHPVAASRTLTAKQHQLVRELLACSDVPQAAQNVGVHKATAYRWVALPEFQAELRQADREVLTATSRRLARLGTRAVEVLAETMDDPEAPAAVGVRAADAVLTKLLQIRETVDMDERLTALEAAAVEQERDRG